MATKKVTKKTTKSSNVPTEAEKAKMAKNAEANMKKLGIKTVDEYIAYIDKKRGY